jgi:hypothetical protein
MLDDEFVQLPMRPRCQRRATLLPLLVAKLRDRGIREIGRREEPVHVRLSSVDRSISMIRSYSASPSSEVEKQLA